MSRRKEKKIKRLRRHSIWPQIIEAFIVETVIVIVCILSLAVNFLSHEKQLISVSQNKTEQIIKQVGTNWDFSQSKLNPQAEDFINNCLYYNSDTISGVALFDRENNLLASYGAKMKDSQAFFRDFDKNEFEENGIYLRTSLVEDENDETADDETYDEAADDTSDEAFDEIKEAEEIAKIKEEREKRKSEKKRHISMVKTLFNKDSSYPDPFIFSWFSEPVNTENIWILFKTDVPGLNVAVQKRMDYSQADIDFQDIIIIIFAICFVFIACYENYKVVLAIAGKWKIQKLVFTDPVTAGHNKDFFISKATKYIKKRHRRYAIVYLRMEKYRNYVTAYGIKEGENLMEDFYKLLLKLIQKRREIVAHLEKSDFILLLHYDNDELLNIRMQAVAQALNESRPNQHIFFSVGAVRILTRSDPIPEKITNAGAAISKQENKTGNVLWFDEAMREEQIWERRVEDDMDKALENKEFKVFLQPKYSTKKEELSAAEALVRWIHPEYGFVSPAKFIPIFERNGFITKLDDFMLTEVAKLQAQWLQDGRKLVPISVNVSRAHFTQENLAQHICEIVDEYKVPHKYIELELTESAFFDDKQTLLGTVKKLKEFGFTVSMDDFGAGYSSLNSLKELPLDIIKLDAQFFRDIEDKKRADLIVCDTIKLAKKLGMQIVAEGIETREQVDFLAGQHCDLIQGFYFSKPLPINEFEEKAFQSKSRK